MINFEKELDLFWDYHEGLDYFECLKWAKRIAARAWEEGYSWKGWGGKNPYKEPEKEIWREADRSHSQREPTR